MSSPCWMRDNFRKPGESVSQVVQVLVDKVEKEVRLQWKFVPIEPEYSGPEWVPICLRGRIVAADTMTPFGPVRSVNLKGSELADDLLLDVGTLATIEQLDISYSYVTDAGLEHLKGLTNLKWLKLNNVRVTDAGLKCLKNMANLTGLELDETQITDAGLEQLTGLTRLQWFRCNGTQVTEEGKTRLRTALRGCTIH